VFERALHQPDALVQVSVVFAVEPQRLQLEADAAQNLPDIVVEQPPDPLRFRFMIADQRRQSVFERTINAAVRLRVWCNA
jgi:hypothetical protein